MESNASCDLCSTIPSIKNLKNVVFVMNLHFCWMSLGVLVYQLWEEEYIIRISAEAVSDICNLSVLLKVVHLVKKFPAQ